MDGLLKEEFIGAIRTVPVFVRKRIPNLNWCVKPEESFFLDEYHQVVKPKRVEYYLERWINEYFPIEDSLLSHFVFEAIHPFIDGNGRVGRFLWAWQRLNNGSDILPMLSFFEGDFIAARSNYYEAIDRTRKQAIPNKDLYNNGKVQYGHTTSKKQPRKRGSAAHAKDAEASDGS